MNSLLKRLWRMVITLGITGGYQLLWRRFPRFMFSGAPMPAKAGSRRLSFAKAWSGSTAAAAYNPKTTRLRRFPTFLLTTPAVIILIVFVFVVLVSMPPPGRDRESPSNKNGQLKVWVNARSGFYYCPDSQFYGVLRPGEVLTQDEALRKGFRLPPYVPCK